MKVIELAKQLGKSLAESEAFQNYQKAKASLEEHESAKIMLGDFRKKQWELEQKRSQGDQLLEPLEQELRKLAEIIGLNPYIREYIMAEVQFSQIMIEIQDIIATAVGLKLPETNSDGGDNNEKA